MSVIVECWQSIPACERELMARADLTGVTSIDGPGTSCLAAMHREGAEFVAAPNTIVQLFRLRASGLIASVYIGINRR